MSNVLLVERNEPQFSACLAEQPSSCAPAVSRGPARKKWLDSYFVTAPGKDLLHESAQEASSRVTSRASLSLRIPADRAWRNRRSGVNCRNSMRATRKGCSQQHRSIFAAVRPSPQCPSLRSGRLLNG